MADSRHLQQDAARLASLLFQHIQIGAEDFDRQRAFQAGFRLVYGVFGRLRVVENYAWESREFLVDGRNQVRFGVNGAVPDGVAIRFQAHIKFVIEEAGGIRSVIRAAEFVSHSGHLGKAAEDIANFWRKFLRFIERNGVGRGGSHPDSALIQVRHELRADGSNQYQRATENNQAEKHRNQAIPQTPAEHGAIELADGIVDAGPRLVDMPTQEIGAQYGQQCEAADQRADQRK